MPGFGTGSSLSSASRSAITKRNRNRTARTLCVAKREKTLSRRPRKRSDTRGEKIAGRTNASVSRIVIDGSESQVGIEESIKGSEKHPSKNGDRAIQDPIVEDKTAKSAGEATEGAVPDTNSCEFLNR